jgi:hypothetical protein
VLTRWRTKLRRKMNERDMFTRGIHTDCLLNYETVKYFNGEEHEAARYHEAVKAYQSVELRVIRGCYQSTYNPAAAEMVLFSVDEPAQPCSELHHCECFGLHTSNQYV